MGLEELFNEGYGYKPLVLTADWQVAQLTIPKIKSRKL